MVTVFKPFFQPWGFFFQEICLGNTALGKTQTQGFIFDQLAIFCGIIVHLLCKGKL